MKLLFSIFVLGILIYAESPRLAVPLKDFFQSHTDFLSIVILSVSVSISVIGGRAINLLTGFLIFCLVLSGWVTDLKNKYDTIIQKAEQSAENQKLPIRKLKEKSGCWHRKDDKNFYNNCMYSYIQERNQTLENNKLASAHNAKLAPVPDLIEFYKLCGIAFTVSLFFSVALWYYSKLAGEELPKVREYIVKRNTIKEIDHIDRKESESLTERLKALDTVQAVSIVLEKRLAENDWQAVQFLSTIRPLNVDAEYRKVRRAKQSVKKLSKQHSGLRVVNGGKE